MDGAGRAMMVEDLNLATAVRLMRLALPLLDRCGRDLAAALLQHAIDEAGYASARVVAGDAD